MILIYVFGYTTLGPRNQIFRSKSLTRTDEEEDSAAGSVQTRVAFNEDTEYNKGTISGMTKIRIFSN